MSKLLRAARWVWVVLGLVCGVRGPFAGVPWLAPWGSDQQYFPLYTCTVECSAVQCSAVSTHIDLDGSITPSFGPVQN